MRMVVALRHMVDVARLQLAEDGIRRQQQRCLRRNDAADED